MFRLILVVVALGGVAGCAMEERVLSTSFGFEPAGSRDRGGSTETTGGASDGGATWAIALGEFKGDDHHERAERMAEQIAAFADTDDVWVDQRSSRSMIYHGRYASRNDRVAQGNLSRWREYVRMGQMRLPGLMLVPINEYSSGSASEYALERGVEREMARRQEEGEGPPKYTLQIGMYDEDFGENFREVAEEAVATLREDGWEAYFWHGPVRTTLMVGFFDDEALEDDSEQALQVEALRRQFPKNSLNGRTIRMTSGGKTAEQRSELVALPR
ncbi:MAG: hypothetical protein WD294_15775 [Phycisphaeraceae bacterium]